MAEQQQVGDAPERKYEKDEIVFIRCRVVNYDFLTKGFDVGSQKAIPTPDRGEYVLETVDRNGRADGSSRIIWIQDSHLVSLAEAKRAVRR